MGRSRMHGSGGAMRLVRNLKSDSSEKLKSRITSMGAEAVEPLMLLMEDDKEFLASRKASAELISRIFERYAGEDPPNPDAIVMFRHDILPRLEMARNTDARDCVSRLAYRIRKRCDEIIANSNG